MTGRSIQAKSSKQNADSNLLCALSFWLSTFALGAPPSSRDRLEADAPSDRGRNDAQLGHQAIELRGVHRLRAVAPRVIGIAMDFDDQAVGACGHGGPSHRHDHVTPSGA